MSYNKEEALQKEIEEMLKEKEESPKTEPVIESKPETEIPSSSEYQPKDEWETEALKIGWNPNHDGKTFVDAKEYVLRKPLFERIERQNKEMSELKASQRKHAEHLAQVRREAYEQAQKDLQIQTEQAVAEANTLEWKRLDNQAKNLARQMLEDPIVNSVPKPEPVAPHPELVEFGKRSANWYNLSTPENSKMKVAADAVDSYLYAQAKIEQGLNVNDPTQVPKINVKKHTQLIEEEVKRLFPHRFNQTNATRTDSAPAVGRSTTSSRDSKAGNTNLVSRLTPQQRELGEKFHRSNPEFTLETYAQELEKNGRLGK